MSDFDQVAWFPLCIGLTAAGLAASWLAWRRRGVVAGLRGAAWSLLPLAAYLTGVIKLLWQVGSAVTRWVSGFVFSPTVWAGVGVTALSALLFAVSGALRRRRPKTVERPAAGAPLDEGRDREKAIQPAQPAQAARGRGRKAEPDDEFADIEDILRRRGIT